MGITSKVDHNRGIIVAVGEGILTRADWTGFTVWVQSDPELSRYDKLMDLRRVVRIDMTADETRDVVSRIPRDDSKGPAYRVAIVAESDLIYGMSRMYEMLREGTVGEVRSFRDMRKAMEWLGLSGD